MGADTGLQTARPDGAGGTATGFAYRPVTQSNRGPEDPANTAKMGDAAGRAWRDTNDYTITQWQSLGYIGNLNKDGSKNESATALSKTPLGITTFGGNQGATLDDSQAVVAISGQTSPGAGQAQATFTTDATGAVTVSSVDAYVYNWPDLVEFGDGTTVSGSLSPGKNFVFDTTKASQSGTALGSWVKTTTSYTSAAAISGLTTGNKVVIVLVPNMSDGTVGLPATSAKVTVG